MVLPECLRSAFADLDAQATALSFGALQRKVAEAAREEIDNLPPDERARVQAELFAVGLHAGTPGRPTQWGRFFGPRWSLEGQDIPSRDELTAAYLDYWVQRSAETTAPVLTARYADAAWEFRRDVTGPRVSADKGIDSLKSVILSSDTSLLKLTRPWNSPRAKLVLIKGTLDLGDSTSNVGVVTIGGRPIKPGSYTAANLMALGLGGTFSGTGKLNVQR